MKYVLMPVFIIILLLSAAQGSDRSEQITHIRHLFDTGKFSEAQSAIATLNLTPSDSALSDYFHGLEMEYKGYDWDAMVSYLDAIVADTTLLDATESFITTAIRIGELDKARTMALFYIKELPRDPHSYWYAFQVAELQGNFDMAREYIKGASQVSSDADDILLHEIDLEVHESNSEAALAKLAGIKLDTAEKLAFVANMYDYLNLGDSALAYMQKAAAADPESIEYTEDLGWMLFKYLRLNEGADLADKLIARAKDYGPAFILRAYIGKAANDPVNASPNFYKFMNLNRESPLGIARQAEMNIDFKEYNLAGINYQTAWIQAVNKQYPHDYIREVYMNMMNAMLEDRDIPTAFNFLADGMRMTDNLKEMRVIRAELMNYFDEVKDSAIILVDNKMDKYWSDRQWLEYVARYARRTGKRDMVNKVCRRLLEFKNPQPAYYIDLLENMSKQNDVAGADSLMATLSTRFANNRTILEYLHDMHWVNADTAKALIYAEKLHAWAPEYLPYIKHLAALYAARGKGTEARDLYTYYVSKYPDKPDGQYELARFDYDQGRVDSAMNHIELALSIDGNYGSALELKGIYFLDKGEEDTAMYYFRRTVMMNWPSPLAYYYLGEHLLQQNDSLSRVEGLGMAAVRFFDHDPRGYDLLSRAYMAQKKYKLARTNCIKGSLMFPDRPEFYFMLGKALIGMELPDEAKIALENSLKHNLSGPAKEEAERLLKNL